MRLCEHIHKRQRGKLATVGGEHRNKDGDARPDNEDQRHDDNQRADNKAVTAEPLQAGEGQRHDGGKGDKQHNDRVTEATSFNGGADGHKRHAQQCPARVKIVAAALLTPGFAQGANQQHAGQQIPQPTDVNVRPAVGVDNFIARGLQQAVIQAPAWQQREGQPAEQNPKEYRIPLWGGMECECV